MVRRDFGQEEEEEESKEPRPRTNPDRIQYVIDIIEKETKRETKLVKLLLYAGFSTYTNDPMNVMINSRKPGEGKTHLITRVLSYFPDEDIIILSGSSDKALYHEKGPMVVKDGETGRWMPIQPKLDDQDSEISEINQGFEMGQIDKASRDNRLEKIKKEKAALLSKASKLISLEHKVLVFLDTPNGTLLEAIMPLLSHDAYESKYKFTDKKGGKLEGTDNILWGWPTVIFAQTIDITHRKRFPELARRFILVNPTTSTEKVGDAVDLAIANASLPDLAYQNEIVTDKEKHRARSIARDLKFEFLEFSKNLRKPDGRYDKDKSAVFVPFDFALKDAFPKRDMNDVTNAKRFLRFQTLSTITNIERRPIIRVALNEKALDPTSAVVVKAEELKSVIEIPIAVFADTEKAIELMQDASNTGLRPEQNKWYRDIFLQAFDAKTSVGEKDRNGKLVKEDRKALTTEELTKVTQKYWHEVIDPKKIRDDYLEPLCNNGVIVKLDSQIDKRTNIYFPVTELFEEEKYTDHKNKKLSRKDIGRNFLEDSKLNIKDIKKIPTQQSIKSRIQAVLRYYEQMGYSASLFDGRETLTDIDTAISIYFNEVEMERVFVVNAANRTLDENYNERSGLHQPSERINYEGVENKDNSHIEQDKDGKHTNLEVQDSTILYADSFTSNFLSTGNGSTLKDDIFWEIFDGLEKEKQDDKIVSLSAFRMALISSGRFTAGEAIQAMKDALTSGKLTKAGFDELCRK